MRTLVISLTLSAAIAYAQPRIDLIQNNYSYLLPTHPNYGIAQGSIFIVKGANLATTTTGLQNPPLRTTLDGVSAKVTVNGTTRDILWYYVTPGQLGGVLPSNVPVGTGTLTVTNSTGTSAPASIKVVESAFGTISLDGSGTGQAAAFNVRSGMVTPTDSARPGETIILFGSGLGPIDGDDSVPPSIANLPSPISIQIGGLNATIQYHGRSTFAALDQINVIVPAGVTPGCNVPVIVTTGQYASNVTTIPIAANGGQCPTPSGGSSEGTEISQAEINSWIAAGQYRVGSVGLTRQWSYTISDNPLGGAPTTSLIKSDSLTGGFNRVSGLDLQRLLTSNIAPPAAGQCTVYQGIIQNPFPNLTYTSLDAGPSIGVSGPAGSRSAARSRNSVGVLGYSAEIGTADPGNYIDPGRYTFTGTGGPDVGAFSGSINVAPDLQWTNRASISVVDRGQPLTVQWSGGEPTTLVSIQGTSTTSQGTSVNVASLTCTARNTDRQFTVPASILGQLPASARITAGTVSILIRGSLAIASVGTGARVTASGVDYFTLGNQWGIAQSTEYK